MRGDAAGDVCVAGVVLCLRESEVEVGMVAGRELTRE